MTALVAFRDATLGYGQHAVLRGFSLDILDHAAPRLAAGHKIGFDATRKIPGEEVNGNPVRDWPPLIVMDEAMPATVRESCIAEECSGRRIRRPPATKLAPAPASNPASTTRVSVQV